MDSDDFRFWSVIVALIAAASALVIGGLWISCRHEENMAKLGYEETPALGTFSRFWRKTQTAQENRLADPVPLDRTVEGHVTTNRRFAP